LESTKVDASDIRAGSALILAGLAARGDTIVDNIFILNEVMKILMENCAN